MNCKFNALTGSPRGIHWLLAVLLYYLLLLETIAAGLEEDAINVEFQLFLWPGIQHDLDPFRDSEALKKQNNALRDDQADEMNPSEEAGNYVPYLPARLFFRSYGEDNFELIELAQNRLSKKYRFRGNGPIVFYREALDASGELQYKPVGQYAFTGTASRKLLFVQVGSENNSPRVRLFGVENTMDRIPRGQALVYNLSSVQLACRIVDEQAVLNPGDNMRLSLSRQDEQQMRILVASHSNDNGWELRHQQRLAFRDDSSLLILVFSVDEANTRFRVTTLSNE